MDKLSSKFANLGRPGIARRVVGDAKPKAKKSPKVGARPRETVEAGKTGKSRKLEAVAEPPSGSLAQRVKKSRANNREKYNAYMREYRAKNL